MFIEVQAEPGAFLATEVRCANTSESGRLISFFGIAIGIFLSPPAAGFIIGLIFYFFVPSILPYLCNEFGFRISGIKREVRCNPGAIPVAVKPLPQATLA